ncbi:N-acetylmuramoyl-L-alanine amidase [Sediminibacillus albus]|uniref:N-acetylmuramoyl-L-alanine amidase n=1 Tax=Sediminibacillus albus TaxID=407036 RepID=A0A1G8WXE5_9BACI|nr:N-acetylmuramoyl-L-alanine amidase [Sediminibacillus albus]SDJ82737.1 N-acetylmuramoyl-L-alanine amidase [Sediminibacillus albus]
MVRVAIDIGHGSNTWENGGGKGVVRNGIVYEEHDFNSLVAQELDRLLNYNGISTLLYQQPFSPEVGLTQRTNYYNSQNVDLVWSIHANASSSTSAEGRCAFYWYTSSAARRLAELYVEEVTNAGYNTHGTGLHASQPNSWTNLHICRETNMTAVLTENGFMTNNADFERIFGSNQAVYVANIARAHAKAICRFFNINFNDDGGGGTGQKYIEILADSLWTYNTADWNDRAVIVNRGEVFTVIRDRFYVDGGYMYQIKSGLYITANPTYVRAYTR